VLDHHVQPSTSLQGSRVVIWAESC
jgi:hypothetical protein